MNPHPPLPSLLLNFDRCLIMRPNTAFEGSIRPRKQSTEQIAPSPGPTTFFLATESDLDRRGSSAPASQDSSQRTSKDTIEAGSPRKTSPSKAPIQAHPPREGSRRRSTIRPKSIEGLRHEAIRQQTAQKQRTPGSLTPDLPSSQEPSLPSSPKSISSKSLPKSDDDLTQDESSSQAIESEDDEGEEPGSTSLQDSAPQLIMPSIRMPSRRPFTERGKKLGKFKILVAGSRGDYMPFQKHQTSLTRHRQWQDVSDQIHCPVMRRHRACRSTRY